MSAATPHGHASRFTFRRRIAGACVLTGVVAAAVASGSMARQAGMGRRRDAEQRLADMAQVLCRNTDSYLALHVAALTQFADHTTAPWRASANAPSPDGLGSEALAGFQQRFPGFLTLLVADGDGVVRHTSRPNAQVDPHFSVADRPYFQAALRGEAPFVSEAFLGRGLGKDPLIAVSVPLRERSGRVVQVLEGSLDLHRLGTVAVGVPAPSSRLFFAILDPGGRVLHASRAPPYPQWKPLATVTHEPLVEALRRTPAAQATTVEGEAGASCITARGWRIIVGQPAQELVAAETAFWPTALLILTVVGLGALVIGSITSRRLSKPLTDLIERIDAMGPPGAGGESGDQLAAPGDHVGKWAVSDDVSRASEWQRLALHLHALDTRVRTADQALRHVVASRDAEIAERTARLAELNHQLALELQTVAAADETLREREARYRHLIESASDIIGTTDVHGRLSYVNTAAEHLLGYAPGSIVGQPFARFVHPDHRPMVRAAVEQQYAQGHQSRYLEFPLLHQDGSSVWVGASMQLLKEAGAVVGMQAVARDISARRASDQQRAEFLAAASHELRTPLTSVHAALGLFERSVSQMPDTPAPFVPAVSAAVEAAVSRSIALPPTAKRLLAIAQSNTQRLIRLTDSLLDLQRFGHAMPAALPQPYALAAMVEEAAQAVRGSADERSIQLQLAPGSETLMVDREGIVRVLINLLSNAIKYAPSGSVVQVASRRTAKALCIEVRDRGPGVPLAEQERIFERFQRGRALHDQDVPGSGLGLAICREVALRHGGSVHYEDRRDGGSSFVLTLPRLAAAQDAA
jgi:PAS domain S-box-containing protein